MPEVKVLTVGLLESLHEFGQGLIGTFYQQMDVIGHQAVGMDGIVIFFPVPGQSFQIGQVVLVVKECFSSLVSSHNDVVEKTRGEQSWATSHREIF